MFLRNIRIYILQVGYFPHEISDLSIALGFVQVLDRRGKDRSQSLWALEYIVLLWISLICMIPFDLAQFDEAEHTGHTARAIETAAKNSIGKTGLGHEGAAILFARLYAR